MTIRNVVIEKHEDGLTYVRVGENGCSHLISPEPISNVQASPTTTQARAYGHIDYTNQAGEARRKSMMIIDQIVTLGTDEERP